LTGAQILIGLREFADGVQQEAERSVGDFLVEHFRRVGDDDAVLARPLGVDVVVADAEARNLLELRKFLHEGGVELVRGIGDRDGSDLAADRADELVLVLGINEVMQVDLRLEPFDHHGLLAAEQHHIRLFARHRCTPRSLQK
jgi:hypothetical protein